MADQARETPESRLYTAGFTRQQRQRLGGSPSRYRPPSQQAKSAPTNAELRQRAAKLGVELPPTY